MKKDPAHIAIVIGSMRMGGAERAALNLANGFAEAGRCVSLVLMKAEGEFLNSVRPSVKIVDLNCSHARYSIPALRRFMLHSNPDILLCFQNHVQTMVLLTRKTISKKIPIVLVEQSTFSKNQNKKWTEFLARKFFPGAEAVVAASHASAVDFSKAFPTLKNKLNVIPNPVYQTAIRELSIERLDHPFLAANNYPLIIGVGRLVASKDFTTLIKAFSIARSKLRMKLVIIGEGEERQLLETTAVKRSIQSDFYLPGYVANPYNWMNRAAVFVMSSLYEGFPFALVEAMACGCTIVSTDCPGGSAEILNHGEFGHLVPVGDANGMANAIVSALENPAEKNKVSLHASEFSSEKSVNAYIRLVEEILEQ